MWEPNYMAVNPMVDIISPNVNFVMMLEEKLWDQQISRNNPPGTMNLCIKFHGNPSNS